MRHPTLKDIAADCGVSTATVSMVLAGKGSISPDMTDRIKKSADELGYARRVPRTSKGPSFKYVCIIQWEDAPFLWHFSQPFVLQLEKILVEMGFRPMVIHKQPALDDTALYNEIRAARVGAVFSIHYVNPVLFDEFEKMGIPVIILNNNNYQDRYWSVLTDDIQGTYEGTRHLLGLGHRRFAYAEYRRPESGSVVRDRFFGFKRALDEVGIDFSEDSRITVDLRDQSGLERRVTEVFGRPDRPTALVVHDDYFGAIVHRVLTSQGLCIPADLSMICPGDVLDYHEPFFPRLSTMQIDLPLMISLSWDLLLSRLVDESARVKVLKTKMQLVDRGSCTPPGGAIRHPVNQE
ncbi:MAG: LacI family DNA-binding transcriptional regulator [Spirochaetia bacterium]|jgi:LacI family transcriptional regulator|nr:LacI family DNA-binding transcriptional regulator [Spirochaetia bacterium]